VLGQLFRIGKNQFFCIFCFGINGAFHGKELIWPFSIFTNGSGEKHTNLFGSKILYGASLSWKISSAKGWFQPGLVA
jgi:hypothetical protein